LPDPKGVLVDNGAQSPWICGIKRVIDIVVATIALFITIPLFPLIALAIKLDSPGPVIFRQVRIGAGGQPFVIFKFRSMVQDAERRLADLIDIHNLEAPAFKLENDPRVTRVGRFLRKSSLDELPQFWNVLCGPMSLVGPRPEEEWVVALYSEEHKRRLAVKPGMTGPMQVNGRADLKLEQRLAYEVEYIEQYSLWRDFIILLKTVPVILSRRGAR